MASNQQLKLLATIAHHLGDGWRIDQREEDRLALINGALRISATFGGWRQSEKGRIFFRGQSTVPGHWLHQSCWISVSENRACKSIAQDIKKRLLPDYEKAIAKLLQNRDTRKQSEQEMQLVCQLFEKIGLRGFRSVNYTRSNNGYAFGDSGAVRGQIDFWQPQDIELSVSGLTAEQAVQLAYFIKTNLVTSRD